MTDATFKRAEYVVEAIYVLILVSLATAPPYGSVPTTFAMDCGPICLELVKGLPAAFVAMIVAGIAAFIAWRQYKVARAKLNLDLFQQRYEFYDIVWTYLSQVLERDPRERPGHDTFANSFPKAHFLFGADMAVAMEKVQQRIYDANNAHFVLRTAPQLSEAWVRAQKTVLEVEGEVREEISNLKRRFGPYMNFEEWR